MPSSATTQNRQEDVGAIVSIEASLISLVRRAADPRGNRRINALAGVDLERAAAAMLTRIGELEPARLSRLAEATFVEMSTASRHVARLIDGGYVRQEPDPTDGRATMHRLTPQGRDTLRRLQAARHRWFDEMLVDFDDDERRQFADLLHRFVARVTDQL